MLVVTTKPSARSARDPYTVVVLQNPLTVEDRRARRQRFGVCEKLVVVGIPGADEVQAHVVRGAVVERDPFAMLRHELAAARSAARRSASP